jgi:2-polyprenyl-3-methyl-5-hydroxy-6-metoxy-1,4-benzoquinol methylase
MTEPSYEQKLAAEAELWGTESERMARLMPPDWRYHKLLRHNIIMHADDIEGLLSHIRPGMKTLELGSASGWLTLAMAQKGADATGIELSEKSIQVAQGYYESIRGEVPGTVTYQIGDLNHLTLPPDTYDVIAVKATLHHLVNVDKLIEQIHGALKPGGLLWASDTNGEEAFGTVLIAGGLTFVLPTDVGYLEKFRALLRFGLNIPSRVRASMEAEGLSPFEGAGREHNWLELIEQKFRIEKRVDLPAFTGYVTAQVKGPYGAVIPLLKAIRSVDRRLVQLKLLRNTGVTLYARK